MRWSHDKYEQALSSAFWSTCGLEGGMMQFFFFLHPLIWRDACLLMYTLKGATFATSFKEEVVQSYQDKTSTTTTSTLMLPLPRTFFANFWTGWNVIFATKGAAREWQNNQLVSTPTLGGKMSQRVKPDLWGKRRHFGGILKHNVLPKTLNAKISHHL